MIRQCRTALSSQLRQGGRPWSCSEGWSWVLGTALGAPFDMDVGAGHPIFHVVLGLVVGLAAW